MRIAHMEEVCIFREVMGSEQALVQQIVVTVEEEYLADIRNRTTKPINDTVVSVLTHLKDNYGQLMPHKLLEREEIIRRTNYNLLNPIATMLSAVQEIFKFSDITGTSYTQLQSVNIAYVIIHNTGKYGLAICEWNRMPEI